MKKIILLGFAFGALALTSCKKDWTCVCEGVPIVGTFSDEIKDKTRSDAKSECESKNTYGGVTVNDMKCSLK